MADWPNLGDPEAFRGLPYPASPVTASGQDPDEVWEQMMEQQSHAPSTEPITAGVRPGVTPVANSVQPVQAAPQPAAARPPMPPPNFEPAGFNADVARQAMSGQLSAGKKLADTSDQMQDDPEIARLQQRKLADEGAAPQAGDYKPGFGTRLLRGLKGVALGAAQGGIFGAATGALDPALVRGGTAYGAPTDAYDVALQKNKQQVATDTEQLGNAQENFKRAQDLRAAREKATQESGDVFGKAGTTATTQESEEEKQGRLVIDKEKADTEASKDNPQSKLDLTQQQIDQRTKQADRMRMPPGYMRTRYILTGEMQPGHEPTAEEIAVNRIVQTFTQQHNGKGPQTVAEWQQVYSAAKGGTGAGGGEAGKDLREAASLAEKHLKTLEGQKSAKGYVLLTDDEKKKLDDDIQDARNQYSDLSARLTAGAGAGAAAPAGGGNAQPAGGGPPKWQQGTPEGKFSPDGKFVAQGGGWVKSTAANGRVRLSVPDPQHPGKTRVASFPPEAVGQAVQLGATWAGNQGQ